MPGYKKNTINLKPFAEINSSACYFDIYFNIRLSIIVEYCNSMTPESQNASQLVRQSITVKSTKQIRIKHHD